MANLKVPNLCGTSLEFNSIQTAFEKLITSALDGLEVDASTLSSTTLSDFNSLELEHRNLIPKIPALPNLNLQSLVTSLSSLTPGSFEHTQLLSNITTDFGTELTAGGYDLDKLVSTALSTIQGGGDLCSAVPNFELPADGLTAAAEKAVESKQPTVDSAEEKTSTLWSNPDVVAQKAELGVKVQKMIPEPSTAVDVVADTVTSTTLPIEDTGAYKVATETSNVTTTEGVKVETTTPEDSITSTTTITEVSESNSTKTQTTITSGGGVTTRTRANTSEKGFTGRPIWVLEEITEDDFTFNDNGDYEIELKHTPLGISWVRGWNDSSTNKYKWIKIYKGDRVERNLRLLEGSKTEKTFVEGGKVVFYDLWSLDGKILTITDGRGAGYGPSKEDGPYFKVRYKYADTYDPRFTVY
tara:strand:+ start:1027 stop:2265 length:1239 start_codon:yes stop_codon:yes gene_type:complete